MSIYPESTDNAALREVSKSSKGVERLTTVLIVLTAALFISSLPTFGAELLQHPTFISLVFIAAVITVALVTYAIIPERIVKFLKAIYLLFRYKQVMTTRASAEGGVGISVRATVVAHNPFTAEDFISAVFLMIISGVFLWLSLQLKNIFPVAAVQVMWSLVVSMLILFIGSILILVIMLYRTLKH